MITPQATLPEQVPEPFETHFIIGQDAAGQWLALETHRLCGGVFRSCQSAIKFVELETGRRLGAYELSPTLLALTF